MATQLLHLPYVRLRLDVDQVVKVLVVCRLEHAAKAPAWMTALDGIATFVCSTYGNQPEPDVHHLRGGKWVGIVDFFHQNPDLINAYDYFWFPDDDIQTQAETALDFLKLCTSEGLELAQPALLPSSYFAYRETIANPRFRLRRTNFVELMMPLMRRDFLVKILPLLEGKHAALGIDWVWQTIAREPFEKVAIVDLYPMLHGRPRNLHLAGKMNSQGISLAEERAKTFASHDIQPMSPIVYSGRLKGGAETRSKLRLAFEIALGYLSVKSKIVNGRWPETYAAKLAWRQLRASR
jgi:hypothetical protein